jgi:hypothetical protein
MGYTRGMKTARRAALALVLATTLAAPMVAQADVYMHGPRGSNGVQASSDGGSLLWDLVEWLIG